MLARELKFGEIIILTDTITGTEIKIHTKRVNNSNRLGVAIDADPKIKIDFSGRKPYDPNSD